jgi:hypothetical protein
VAYPETRQDPKSAKIKPLAEIRDPKKKVDNLFHPDIIRHPRPQPKYTSGTGPQTSDPKATTEGTEIIEILAKQLRTWMATDSRGQEGKLSLAENCGAI